MFAKIKNAIRTAISNVASFFVGLFISTENAVAKKIAGCRANGIAHVFIGLTVGFLAALLFQLPFFVLMALGFENVAAVASLWGFFGGLYATQAYIERLYRKAYAFV